MKQIAHVDMKLVHRDDGFCISFYKGIVHFTDGTTTDRKYCKLDDEGWHTHTDWGEPECRLSDDLDIRVISHVMQIYVTIQHVTPLKVSDTAPEESAQDDWRLYGSGSADDVFMEALISIAKHLNSDPQGAADDYDHRCDREAMEFLRVHI